MVTAAERRAAEADELEPTPPGSNGRAPNVATVDDLASLDAIFEGDDRPIVTVTVPEWGDKVFCLRAMKGTAMEAWARAIERSRGKSKDDNIQDFRAKLIVHSLVTPAGDRLVPAERRTDYEVKFRDRNTGAIQRLFTVAQKLSGLGEQDVKEMTAELKEIPENDSGSD